MGGGSGSGGSGGSGRSKARSKEVLPVLEKDAPAWRQERTEMATGNDVPRPLREASTRDTAREIAVPLKTTKRTFRRLRKGIKQQKSSDEIAEKKDHPISAEATSTTSQPSSIDGLFSVVADCPKVPRELCFAQRDCPPGMRIRGGRPSNMCFAKRDCPPGMRIRGARPSSSSGSSSS